MLKKLIVSSALLLCINNVLAQDRRQVIEPVLPQSCVTLQANKLVADDRQLSADDEKNPDTTRIQKALDSCPAGQAVSLSGKHNNAFLSGPLNMRSGVTLIIDKDITLYASRNPQDYDYPDAPNICATSENEIRSFGVKPAPTTTPGSTPGKAPRGCRPLIGINNIKNAAVMGQGTIDGRGDSQLIGRDYSWWQMARKAEPGNKKYYSMRLIVAKQADGLTLYGITLHNSPNFHITVNDTDGFTAWGLHLLTPTVAGTDARNTDGIDPSNSTNITLAHNWIHNDDDNVAIKDGVSYISVLHNHFYHGHGMSIGSETYKGVSHLLVDDLVMDGTTSGIRIKSNVTRGGPVKNLVYQNICMQNVGVPIAITPYYNNQSIENFIDPAFDGDKIPDYKGIVLRNISSLSSGEILIAGANEQHRTQLQMDNLFIADIKPKQVHFRLADISYANTNLPLQNAVDHQQTTFIPLTAEAVEPDQCQGKFVPMR